MNKPTEPMNKPTKTNTSDNQRGIGVVELLFTAAALGAAVSLMHWGLGGPKLPPAQGD